MHSQSCSLFFQTNSVTCVLHGDFIVLLGNVNAIAASQHDLLDAHVVQGSEVCCSRWDVWMAVYSEVRVKEVESRPRRSNVCCY